MIKLTEVDTGLMVLRYENLDDALALRLFVDGNDDVVCDSVLVVHNKKVRELEQFKNLADDYNIPFESFYYVVEDLLTKE
jgi:hypothetical protein